MGSLTTMANGMVRLGFLFRLMLAVSATIFDDAARAQKGIDGGPLRPVAGSVADVVRSGGHEAASIADQSLSGRGKRRDSASRGSLAADGDSRVPTGPERDRVTGRSPAERLPSDFTPWWQSRVGSRLRDGFEAHPIDLEALIVSALAFSPHVRAISQEVLIHETEIIEAEAEFDGAPTAQHRRPTSFTRAQRVGRQKTPAHD